MTAQANGGLGLCNTSGGRTGHCALGGIGCDVDHLLIARQNLAEARDLIARLLPGWSSDLTCAYEEYVRWVET